MNPEILRAANDLSKMGQHDLATEMLRHAAFNDLYDELAGMGDGAYEVAADIRHAEEQRYGWDRDMYGDAS